MDTSSVVESIASVFKSSGRAEVAEEEEDDERKLSTPGRMPDSEERYTWLTCGEEGSMVMITEASSAALFWRHVTRKGGA